MGGGVCLGLILIKLQCATQLSKPFTDLNAVIFPCTPP
jgi:hypothetical protein